MRSPVCRWGAAGSAAALWRVCTASSSALFRIQRAAFESLERRQLFAGGVTSSASTLIAAQPAAAVLISDTQPSVTAVRPGNGATNVDRDIFIGADVHLPFSGQGINPATMTSSTVKLYRTSDGSKVDANRNTSGGGDAIVLQPKALLKANTKYTFEVTSGLKDVGGHSFLPFKITFTTGSEPAEPAPTPIKFDKVTLSVPSGHRFSGITIGPDNRLYVGTLDGDIVRFDIKSDGTVKNAKVIGTVRNKNGGRRLITGITFDPAATADNLVLWVNHGQSTLAGASDWTGKLSRLSGANLENYKDYVTNLPRAVKDHLNNQMAFGPDGALYFNMGSNTAMGAPDNAWGNREERLLSGAILRVDPRKIDKRIAEGKGALNVKTVGDGGSYDPFASGAAVTIYATGVRNAFDLVWHSNGHLYAPTNGSAAGGSSPASPRAPFTSENRIDEDLKGPYTGPTVPALSEMSYTEPDWLFDIEQGRYYGHPNVRRSEYVLNGGNPTSGSDKYEVPDYRVGVKPDRNWDPAIYKFGTNYSPNGIIEYRSSAFNGELKGALLVARYSGGDDVMVMRLESDGDVGSTISGNSTGLGGMKDPLDLVEDVRNGNLYIVEAVESGSAKIVLARPRVPVPPPPPPTAVTGVTLYDADTDQPIAPLTNNMAIDLTKLAGRNLTVVVTSTTGTVRSVRFGIDDVLDHRLETGDGPRSLMGDATVEGGAIDFAGWTPAAGRHTLVVTPYESADGTGAAGRALTLAFTVYDENNPAPPPVTDPLTVTNVTLLNADTEQPIGPLTDGMTINLRAARNLNITAQPHGVAGSVRFGLDANSNFRTETSAPYSLAGNTGADFRSWTPSLGTHTLTVRAFAGANGSGEAGPSVTITFTVVDQPLTEPTPPASKPELKVTGVRIVRADTGALLGTLTDGGVLDLASLPSSGFTLLADIEGVAGSVRFGLDGVASYKVENLAPYAIAGDKDGGGYYAWSPALGAHTLTITPFSGAKATGIAGTGLTLNFTVVRS